MKPTLHLVVALAIATTLAACSPPTGQNVVAHPEQVPTTTPATNLVCAGTGIGSRRAAVSIDIGDLLQPHARASLRVGQQLFVGSNGCGTYSLPRPSAVQPVLVEVSREQRTQGGAGPDLAVVYQAVSPGRETLQVACTGLCNAPLFEIAVEVRDGL